VVGSRSSEGRERERECLPCLHSLLYRARLSSRVHQLQLARLIHSHGARHAPWRTWRITAVQVLSEFKPRYCDRVCRLFWPSHYCLCCETEDGLVGKGTAFVRLRYLARQMVPVTNTIHLVHPSLVPSSHRIPRECGSRAMALCLERARPLQLLDP
jgi:hypothetical protein